MIAELCRLTATLITENGKDLPGVAD